MGGQILAILANKVFEVDLLSVEKNFKFEVQSRSGKYVDKIRKVL